MPKAFICGFCQTLHKSPLDAMHIWDSYSYQLSDTERRKIEARGYRAGQSEARKYLRWFAENEKHLAEMEPHSHTCQQCDKVVIRECECDEPVRNVWCSANCKAAFDL